MIVVNNYLLTVGIFRYPGLIFYSKLLTTKNFELKIFCRRDLPKIFVCWEWLPVEMVLLIFYTGFPIGVMIVVNNYLLTVGIFRYPGLIFYFKLLTTKNFELKNFCRRELPKIFVCWEWLPVEMVLLIFYTDFPIGLINL